MKRTSAILVLAALLVAPAAHAGMGETLAQGAATGLAALRSGIQGLRFTRLDAVVEERQPAKATAGKSRFITLSGHVYLDGTAHVPQGTSYAWVTVSGRTHLNDENGRMLSGSIYVSSSDGYFLNGNYVSGWARPYAYVSVYQDGRYLGNVRIDGNIHVSGWNSNGWVRLSGSGYVRGSGYIEDPTPPAPPQTP